ncbi:MAG TPA: E3 binding domain-containing protein [Spirochaetia bacterium]
MLKVEERDSRLRASPRARALAASRGVSLTGLKGSGPAGRIIVRDIEAVAAAGAPRAAPEWQAARPMMRAAAAGELPADPRGYADAHSTRDGRVK